MTHRCSSLKADHQVCVHRTVYIYTSTYTAISHMRWCFSFTSPVSVWGRGGGSSGGGAGQHPSGAGLLAERGAAVAGPFARRIIGQRGQERREQLLIVPSGLLPVQRATEHARTHTYAHTRTHRDRKEVRLFVYLCRGTECYVFTLFCVVSVLYVSYSWYASLSVACPGTVNFAPKTQTKCKCPEALMWGFLLPLKIKWVILKLIPRWLRTPLVSTFSLLLGSGLLVAKKNTRQNLGTNEWIYLIFKSVNDIFFPCKIIGILPSPVAPRQLFPQPPYCSSCDSYCLQHNR